MVRLRIVGETAIVTSQLTARNAYWDRMSGFGLSRVTVPARHVLQVPLENLVMVRCAARRVCAVQRNVPLQMSGPGQEY
eukprot:35177-Prorocentrum_minimum.AAC.1